jgi:hypothetical protein
MATRFKVPVLEIHKQVVYVEAEDADEALDVVREGGGLYEPETEYMDSLSSEEWPETVEADDFDRPNLWGCDKIQFARLLCELVANVDDLCIEDVAASMDLPIEQVNQLFTRAELVWERSKHDYT